MKRKIFWTCAVFVFAFVVATAVKTQASVSDNVKGWLAGWSDDGAGNPSFVDWISMNDVNPGSGGGAYGVTIPAGDGLLSGYAWDGSLGTYVAFTNDDGYLNGCPTVPCNARREGNNLKGWARFVSIAQAFAVGNSGGWDGWISLDGVSIAGSQLQGYAWAGDQGWVDFSGARISVCGDGDPDFSAGEECDAGAANKNDCSSSCSTTCKLNSTCSLPGICGGADGNSYADIAALNAAGRCSVGTASNTNSWTWICNDPDGNSGTCSATQSSTGSGSYIEVAP